MDTGNNNPQTESTQATSRFERFLKWRQLHVTDSGLLLLLALVVGILSGAAAALLKLIIKGFTNLSTWCVDLTGLDWMIIPAPVVGVVLAALFCKYVLRQPVDNGVSRMVSDLNSGNYRLNGKDIYGSMIASGLTLGFGGTAGSEGPIAYAGAGIGSKLAQSLRLNSKLMMILMGCGAAAGIAGIFKAPIGGALFALEVLRVELSTIAILAVFLATLAAALTAYVLSGCTLDINVISPGAFDNHTLLWAALLGVVCGAYSLYYTNTGGYTKSFLTSQRRQWVRWLSSGLMIGVMVYLFPAMYGEGYGVITEVINGHSSALTHSGVMAYFADKQWLIAVACAGILLLKGIGSSAANNGGGVAGDFAPTLFAGCILGLMFASIANMLGIAHLNTAHYALIAMAGAMAGIIRAPLMAIFLATEMVGGVEFLLPATIVSLISYWMVMLFKHSTFYHSKPYVAEELD